MKTTRKARTNEFLPLALGIALIAFNLPLFPSAAPAASNERSSRLAESNKYSRAIEGSALAFYRVRTLDEVAVELAKEKDAEYLRILSRHQDDTLRKAARKALNLLGEEQ